MNNLKKEFYEKFCMQKSGLFLIRPEHDLIWSWVESKLKEETDKAYNVGKGAGYKQGVEAGYEAGKKREGNLVDKVSKEDIIDKFGNNISKGYNKEELTNSKDYKNIRDYIEGK